MSQMKSKILVPTDFTKVADCAMNHAVKLAQHSGAEVYLLHVVPKQSEAEEARRKLEIEVERAKQWGESVPVHKLVRIGSIFDDIGDAASEINAKEPPRIPPTSFTTANSRLTTSP